MDLGMSISIGPHDDNKMSDIEIAFWRKTNDGDIVGVGVYSDRLPLNDIEDFTYVEQYISHALIIANIFLKADVERAGSQMVADLMLRMNEAQKR